MFELYYCWHNSGQIVWSSLDNHIKQSNDSQHEFLWAVACQIVRRFIV